MTQDDLDSMGDLLSSAFPVEKVTQAERLMRIEILLKRAIEDLDRIATAQAETKKALDADKADLAALKNKGAGVLIGVSIVAGLVGAKIGAILSAIAGVFKP